MVPEYQCAVKREAKKAQKEKDRPNSSSLGSPADVKEPQEIKAVHHHHLQQQQLQQQQQQQHIHVSQQRIHHHLQPPFLVRVKTTTTITTN